jgi:hypothetical protein
MWRRRAFRRIQYISSVVVTAEPATEPKHKRSMRMRISTRKANSAYRLTGRARGATLMEYALLVALGSVIIIIALLAFFRT